MLRANLERTVIDDSDVLTVKRNWSFKVHVHLHVLVHVEYFVCCLLVLLNSCDVKKSLIGYNN